MRRITMKLKAYADSCWVLWTHTVRTHWPPAVTSCVSGYPAARPRRTHTPGQLPQPGAQRGDEPRFWLDTGGRGSRRGCRWLVDERASQADLPHNRAKPTESFRSMSTGQQQRIEGVFTIKAPQPVARAQAEGIYPARSNGRNFSSVFVLVGCVSRNAASPRSGLLRCELLTVTEQPQTDKSLQCTARLVPTVMQPPGFRREFSFMF